MTTRHTKILLLYPSLGFVGSFVKNVPLSLLYCSVDAVKSGLEVEIVDFRLQKEPANIILKKKMGDNVIAVGISVMSGKPVGEAVRFSKLVRNCSQAKIIWGGPHPSIFPEEVLKNDYVDFVIRGYGSKSLNLLLQRLSNNIEDYENIPGLCYKINDTLKIAEINATYEFFNYEDIPYHLIENNIQDYFAEDKRTFPIYSSLGCPYKCAFCIAPVWYRSNKHKWLSLGTEYVIGHMQYLIEKYKINHFYFYDDDSFVRKEHFVDIAREIKKRSIKVGIGVRGIRADELLRLSDDELKLLEDVGTSNLHIGVESGSQRMLDLMNKGIRVEQSIEANRRLINYPNLIPVYNLLVGLPTETMDDLRDTKNLMIQLSKENPNCILLGPSKYIPYPGSVLFDIAVQYGFRKPSQIEGWSEIDQEKEVWMPWYTEEYNRYINMLYVLQNILDNRFNCLPNWGKGWIIFFKFIRWLYFPIGKLRMKYDFTRFLIEYRIIKHFFRQ